MHTFYINFQYKNIPNWFKQKYPQFFTDEYIKEQITMTSALPIVDEKNVIKGNKDKDRSLYDQLEKTSSFDIKEIKKAEKELKRKNKVSKNIKSKSKKKTSSGVKRSSSTKKNSKK